MQYNAEIRGIYNYYCIANNVTTLGAFGYIMKYSMYKTFANKYRTSVRNIMQKYRIEKDFAIRYQTRAGAKVMTFYNKGFGRRTLPLEECCDTIPEPYYRFGKNSLLVRMMAKRCEMCGAENTELEIHHVRRLKDLKGKKKWEQVMIARRRKTLALCVSCHDKLHAGKLD